MQCVASRRHVADRQLSKPVQKQQSTGFHLVRVAPCKYLPEEIQREYIQLRGSSEQYAQSPYQM